MGRTTGERAERPSWLRRTGLVASLCGAIALFLWQVSPHYPIRHWLFWHYLVAWVGALFFALSSLSVGLFTISHLCPRGSLRLAERFTFAFSTGVVEFFLGMVVLGLLGWYGTVLFFAYPLALLAIGARPLYRQLRRTLRHLRFRRRAARPVGTGTLLLWGFGLLALALVYFPILNPNNASFDARWQHLGIAEHYANAHGFVRFPEGWLIATSPHLAGVLYTWAFLLPWSMLFDRVELAAHIEFVCFLATLPAITVLVRRLIPRTTGRAAWVARFVFPGIFVYDSGLILGADHIASLFAVPIFLSLLRAWPALDKRWMALLGIGVSGAVATKYSGALVLVGYPLLALGVRALVLAGKTALGRGGRREFGWLGGIAAIAAVGVVLTAPHWLKNWVWYGNPVYPMLHAHFPGTHPWTADATARFELGYLKHELWRPERNLAGLWQSIKVLATFSFVPNDWKQFHGTIPVFGSLFTLSLLALPFSRPTRRLVSLFAAVHVGIFAWYWTHHQDRYLQAAMPWIAAATASVFVLVWRTGVVARIAGSALVLVQVVWGGDAPFISSHIMTSQPLKASVDLLATGYKKNYVERLKPFPLYAVGDKLPRGAYVLVHEWRPRIGLRARAATDLPGNQGGISYSVLGTPRATWELLHGYGFTHVLWEKGHTKDTDSLAGDIVFWQFAERTLPNRVSVGGSWLAPIPAEPPAQSFNDRVVLIGCRASGLYRIADLSDPGYDGPPSYGPPITPLPAPGQSLAPLLRQAGTVVIEPRCRRNDPGIEAGFQRVCSGKRYEIWLQKP